MRNLMNKGNLEFPLQFGGVLEVMLKCTLENLNLRWQITEVMHVLFGQGRSRKHPVHVGVCIAVELVHQFTRWPIVDEDHDVSYGTTEGFRDTLQGVFHQGFETISVQLPPILFARIKA